MLQVFNPPGDPGERNRYSDQATGWEIRGANSLRDKRFFSKTSIPAVGPTQVAFNCIGNQSLVEVISLLPRLRFTGALWLQCNYCSIMSGKRKLLKEETGKNKRNVNWTSPFENVFSTYVVYFRTGLSENIWSGAFLSEMGHTELQMYRWIALSIEFRCIGPFDRS